MEQRVASQTISGAESAHPCAVLELIEPHWVSWAMRHVRRVGVGGTVAGFARHRYVQWNNDKIRKSPIQKLLRYLAAGVAPLAASSLQEEERQPDRHKKQPISPSGPEVHVIWFLFPLFVAVIAVVLLRVANIVPKARNYFLRAWGCANEHLMHHSQT